MASVCIAVHLLPLLHDRGTFGGYRLEGFPIQLQAPRPTLTAGSHICLPSPVCQKGELTEVVPAAVLHDFLTVFFCNRLARFDQIQGISTIPCRDY